MHNLQLRTIEEFLLAQNSPKRFISLSTDHRRHSQKSQSQSFEALPVNHFVVLPRNPILGHRFLEHYRIAKLYREYLLQQYQRIKQVYPGRIISTVEGYEKPIKAIHQQSEKAVEEFLQKKYSAIIDILLIIEGRIFFIDFLTRENSKIQLYILEDDTKVQTKYYWNAAWLVQGLRTVGFFVDECFVFTLNENFIVENETIKGEMFVRNRLKWGQKFMRTSIVDEVEKLTAKLQGIPRDRPNREAPRTTKQEKITPIHLIQDRAESKNLPQIQVDKLQNFLSELQWPLYFLDFECFIEAVPQLSMSRVWEHIPFLFSLFKMGKNLTPKKLASYCMPDRVDRRFEMAKTLVQATESEGSLLVYGRAMESKVLSYLSRTVPSLSKELELLKERLVDLHTVFKNYWYYHPEQQGRTNLKTITRVLGICNYQEQEIASGGEAFVGYYFLQHRDLPQSWDIYNSIVRNDPQVFFTNVQKYCDVDSISMAEIVKKLIDFEKCPEGNIRK